MQRYKMAEAEKDIVEEVSKITDIDYEMEEYADCKTLFLMINNLIWSYNRLERKISNLNENIRDNFKPKTPYELFGISDNDFIEF